jgi:hypothetical protein
MLNRHSFENEMSLDGSDDSVNESFNVMDEASEERSDNSNEWGIVSVSIDGSQVQVDEERSGRRSHFNSGVLTVDGVDSTLSGRRHHRNYANSNFSIAGTHSLPTSLDGADHLSELEIKDTRGRMRAFCKRPILMLLVPMLCTGMAGLGSIGYLVKERNTWRFSTLRLEEEIQRLERESERIKNTCEEFWDQGQPDKPSNLFPLVDTCWLQAKADIKLGACGCEKKDKIKELSESFKGTWEAMWNAASNLNTEFENEGFPEGDGGKSLTLYDRKRRDRADAITFYMPSIPSYFGEAFSAASVAFSAKIAEFCGESKRTTGEVAVASTAVLDKAVDGLSTATMALNEAMVAASNALSFEIQELSKDPSAYLADVARGAMKEASNAAESGRVTMQGLFDAVADVSSRSWAWGEVARDTSEEAAAVKVTEIMDDPLSNFEFESTKSESL